MDRGFGSNLRGFNSNNRDRFSRDDRRYDDFYSDSRRSSNSGRNNNNNQNRGNWGSSVPRDRGFFNQGNRDRGQVSGQMIAALQQQQHLLNAFMSNQNNRNTGIGNKFNQNRNFNNRDNRGGGGRNVGGRAGDKRKIDNSNHGGKRNKKEAPLPRQEKKQEAQKIVEEEIDIPDDEVEIPDSLMDSVETLRQRKDVERNVADEDVKKLVVFSFTGKGYQCLTCGLFFSKEESFIHHLMGKSHVMNVIDARTAKKYQPTRDILDIDLSPDDWFEKNEKAKAILMKQAKLMMKAQREQEKRDRENYEKNPANFFSVSMATRKTAKKIGDKVAITSLVESTIEVKEFDKDRFFGCEFVKAITGFHCRLCNMQIKEASGVITHVNSRIHKNNYQVHLNRNKTYEKVQAEQNKELLEVLSEHDGANVLLHETDSAKEAMYLKSLENDLVRDKKLLEPPQKKPEEKKESKNESESEKKEDGDKKTSDDDNKQEEGAEKTTEESEEANTTTSTTEHDESKNEENETGAEVKDEESEQQEEKEEDEKPAEEQEAPTEEGDEKEAEVNDGEESQENTEDEATESTETPDAEETKPPPKLAAKRNSTPRRGTAKRGRARGARVTPSPRSRRAAVKTKSEEGESQESSEAASTAESFEVVDDIDEE